MLKRQCCYCCKLQYCSFCFCYYYCKRCCYLCKIPTNQFFCLYLCPAIECHAFVLHTLLAIFFVALLLLLLLFLLFVIVFVIVILFAMPHCQFGVNFGLPNNASNCCHAMTARAAAITTITTATVAGFQQPLQHIMPG